MASWPWCLGHHFLYFQVSAVLVAKTVLFTAILSTLHQHRRQLFSFPTRYVEFIDTWILVLKGKKPSFLQVYHHSGIVFTMWGAVASQSAWLTFVVLLNSVIHTLMYIYFFIKTLSPKTEIKAAKYLTTAQIVQFYTGILGTLGVLFMGKRCDTESSRFMLASLDTYGIGLIILFTTFAAQKYKTK